MVINAANVVVGVGVVSLRGQHTILAWRETTLAAVKGLDRPLCFAINNESNSVSIREARGGLENYDRQAGAQALEGSFVRLNAPCPSVRIHQTSKRPAPEVKAMYLPSGDQAGS